MHEDSTLASHEFCKAWMKFEILCSTSRKRAGPNITASTLHTVPRSPTVSVLDDELCRIRVSMPIKSEIGECFYEMHVFAIVDGVEGKELTVGLIGHESIEGCIMEGNDKLSVEVFLPGNGVWNVEWYGLVLRADTVKTPRSTRTRVDLTMHVLAQEGQRRAAIDSMDESARRHAGDIHSVLRKLRGPCSGQVDSKYKNAEHRSRTRALYLDELEITR